jgi:hypothetical protein
MPEWLNRGIRTKHMNQGETTWSEIVAALVEIGVIAFLMMR